MVDGGIFASRLKAYKKQAEKLKGKSLEVGFFADDTYPDGTQVAEVAYWNEFGIPEKNQPPRPFFRQAIADSQSDWIELVRTLIEQGRSIDYVMTALGSEIVSDIQGSIRAFTTPALSPITIAIKRASGKTEADASKPLMDTLVMYQSVQWRINDGD